MKIIIVTVVKNTFHKKLDLPNAKKKKATS